MGNSVVFIDARVADIDSLIAGLPSGTEVVRIDDTADGLDQIVASLQGRTGIDAIDILSCSSSDRFTLGTVTVRQEQSAQHQGAAQ